MIKAGAKAYGLVYWTTLPIEYVIAFAVMMEAFRYALAADPKFPLKRCGSWLLPPSCWWRWLHFSFSIRIFPSAT